MAWVIFGGYFLYTEHAPWWLQAAFVVCALAEAASAADTTHQSEVLWFLREIRNLLEKK